MIYRPYVLTLISRADRDDEEPPEAVRMRNILKFALRACNFRCQAIRPQDDQFIDGDGI